MMKKLFIFVAIICIEIFPQLKWVPMTGLPYNGINGISVTNAGDIYTGHDILGTSLLSGVFVRRSDSLSFRPTAFPKTRVFSIHTAPNGNVMVGDDGGRIHLSTNGGDTWSVPHSGAGYVIYFRTNSIGEIFCLSNEKLMISTNYGLTWQPKNAGGRSISNERMGKMYVVKTGGVHWSSDYGSTWQEITSPGFSFTPNSAWIAENGYLYITSQTNGTWLSTDGGTSFTDITQGLFTTECWSVSGVDGVGVFVANSYGIYKSTDHGNTWGVVLPDDNRNFISVVTTSNGHLYSTSRYNGAYRSTNGGDSWESVSAGLTAYYADRFTSLPSGWIFGSFPGLGIWGSSNNGVTWFRRDQNVVVNNLAYLTRRISATVDGNLIVGANDRLYRSTNLGLNWAYNYVGTFSNTFDGALFNSNGLMVCLSNNKGVFTSTNDGRAWVTRYTASVTNKCYALTLSHDSSVVYFATSNNLIVSTDWMQTWRTSAGSIPSIRKLLAFPDGRVMALCNLKNGVYVSADTGATWELKGALTLPPCYQLIRLADGRLIAANEIDGIFTSTDEGETWEAINSGLLDRNIQDLFKAPNGEIWASTIRGGTHKLTGLTSVKGDEQIVTSIPAGYTLEQNFPNPFSTGFGSGSAETVINYTLPESRSVKIEVFNTMGERVSLLVDGDNSAGNHQIRFNPRGIPSGVYFYRLTAGNHVITKKMTIIR